MRLWVRESRAHAGFGRNDGREPVAVKGGARLGVKSGHLERGGPSPFLAWRRATKMRRPLLERTLHREREGAGDATSGHLERPSPSSILARRSAT